MYLWKVLDLRITEVNWCEGRFFVLSQNIVSQYMKEECTKMYYKMTINAMQ